MKRYLYISLVLLLIPFWAMSQNGGGSIVDELNSTKRGQGNIKVLQDETVEKVLAGRRANISDTSGSSKTFDPNARFRTVRGYKVQAYSGNNQARSKSIAQSRESQIKEMFPEHETTVEFSSPFWRLRIGNFLRKEDADVFLQELKKAFPSYGKEMYVLIDVVKIPIE